MWRPTLQMSRWRQWGSQAVCSMCGCCHERPTGSAVDRRRCPPCLHQSPPAYIRPQPCCSCLNMSIACACHLRIPFPIVLPVTVSAGGELACITSSAHDMPSMTIIADAACTDAASMVEACMAAHKKEKGLRRVAVLMSSCHACRALWRCRWTATVRAAGQAPSQLDVDCVCVTSEALACRLNLNKHAMCAMSTQMFYYSSNIS